MILRLCFLLLVFCGVAKATQQHLEIINFEGRMFFLVDAVPYEMYVKKKEFTMKSTALWRGYIGEWAIVDEELYFKEVHILEAKPDDLFSEGNMTKNEHGILATWYSGEFILSYGDYSFPENETSYYIRSCKSHDFKVVVENGHVTSIQKTEPFNHVEDFLDGRNKISSVTYPEESLLYLKITYNEN